MLFRWSSNCNKLLPADIDSLLDSSISFHMKTERVLFSENLCFRGRLRDGHSLGNQKYNSRPAKRTTL